MRLVDYLETLTATQGAGIGDPLRLLPWQKRFLQAFERTTGDAACSLARGGGKTTFLAAIACAAVDPAGPLHQRRAETIIVGSSFAQGRVAFDHVLAFLRELGHDLDNRKEWRLQDSQNSATVEHRMTGSRVRCLGSDPARAHGLAPLLVIADESAQWPSPTSERMRTALLTSMGKIPGSRMIAIGTRPADPGHWFEVMLQGGADYAQLHAAAEHDPPFQQRTWLKACPSLSIMPELLKRYRSEADDAKRDPSLLAGFKALRLNLGIDDTLQATLLDATTWGDVEGDADRIGPYICGIDAGSSASMTACAGYWYESTAFDAFGVFPEQPGLRERGLRDGVGRAYMDMHTRDELILAGGRVSDLGAMLREVLKRWGQPAAVVVDRWRQAELADAMDAVRFPRVPMVVRGQGFKDGGEDVADFRRAVLRGRVVPSKSLLMRSAMSEARVTMDASGNSKLSKGVEGGRRKRARDDATAAGILAVATGEREARVPRRGVYFGIA